MRAVGIFSAIIAAVSMVFVSGTAQAQKKVRAKAGVELPGESGCGGNAEKNNRAPTASLRVTPSGSGSHANRTLTLTTVATDPDNDTLRYMYTVSGGRMSGEGAAQIWDLKGVNPGTYNVTANIFDGKGCYAMIQYSVELDR